MSRLSLLGLSLLGLSLLGLPFLACPSWLVPSWLVPSYQKGRQTSHLDSWVPRHMGSSRNCRVGAYLRSHFLPHELTASRCFKVSDAVDRWLARPPWVGRHRVAPSFRMRRQLSDLCQPRGTAEQCSREP